MILRFYFFLLLTCSYQLSSAQDCFIWNGFSIDWTYNHRVNRIGSYIEGDQVFNTGATGLGRDSCHFKTYYTQLSGAGLKTQELRQRIVFLGEEHERITKRQLLKFPVNLTNGQEPQVVLNGFDLVSIAKADKLHDLTVRILEQSLSDDGRFWEVNLEASLLVNCTTPECELMNQEVHYQLDLFLLLIEFPADVLVEPLRASRFFNWSAEDKRERSPMLLESAKGYNQAGIQGFEIALDQDHWILATELSSQSLGDNRFNIALEYIANRWNMKKDSYHRNHSRFSKGLAGEAKLALDLLFMKLPGQLVPKSFKGSIIWPGKNISAESSAAVRSTSAR